MVRVHYDAVLAGTERTDTGFEVVELDVVVRWVASGGLQPHADSTQRVHPHERESCKADEGRPLSKLVDGRLAGYLFSWCRCGWRGWCDVISGVSC